MTESMFQKELMLTRQINQKNVCFVKTGIFLNKNFKYGQYLCDGCYDIVQKSIYILNKKSYKKQRKHILQEKLLSIIYKTKKL